VYIKSLFKPKLEVAAALVTEDDGVMTETERKIAEEASQVAPRSWASRAARRCGGARG
jgi:hypothetical protein